MSIRKFAEKTRNLTVTALPQSPPGNLKPRLTRSKHAVVAKAV